MVTGKIKIGQKNNNLTKEVSKILIENLNTFVKYKEAEEALKKAKKVADDAKLNLMLSLETALPELATTNNFNVVVEGKESTFLVTSKASNQTYITLKEVLATIAKLEEQKQSISKGNSIVKSTPRVTFNIVEVKR